MRTRSPHAPSPKFTIASLPYRPPRRDSRLNRRMLATRGPLTVDGITLVGGGRHWHIDATNIGIAWDDHTTAWAVEGVDVDWFYAADAHRVVAKLRQRGQLPKAAS